MSAMGSSPGNQEHTCRKARVNRWDEPGDTSGTEPSKTSSSGEDDSGSTTSNDGSMEKLKQLRINKGKEIYENKDNQDLFHSYFGKTETGANRDSQKTEMTSIHLSI